MKEIEIEELEFRVNEKLSGKKEGNFEITLDQQKTKKKRSKENGFSSSDKKKREELAKLVEQQGRITKLRERYLSTDLV